jgi:hypothetical protein
VYSAWVLQVYGGCLFVWVTSYLRRVFKAAFLGRFWAGLAVLRLGVPTSLAGGYGWHVYYSDSIIGE